jgi:hypothetical protein
MSGYECVIVQGVMGIFNLRGESRYRDALFSAESIILIQFNIWYIRRAAGSPHGVNCNRSNINHFTYRYYITPSYDEHFPDAPAPCGYGKVEYNHGQSRLS